MSIERLLFEEAEAQLQEIHKLQVGSDESVKAINAVNGMVDRIHEAEKIKSENRRLDVEERKNDIEERRVDSERIVRKAEIAYKLLIAIGYAALEGWAHVSSKKWEEGYTQTTDSGRASTRNLLSLFSRVKP